ncbi:hypothetical protein Maq22A_1p38580 (plasmid) [Methylobacterium aquaticum]|uniref:Uncharacterized protein n=1 Tax=Methylobacterium aquaticum TaxID=270351 RepID=A0A1Y0ZIY9_9HYPH|nr:hypothetical protein Maq22A_1p38580 [Methylobacterium aquaticum]
MSRARASRARCRRRPGDGISAAAELTCPTRLTMIGATGRRDAGDAPGEPAPRAGLDWADGFRPARSTGFRLVSHPFDERRAVRTIARR